MEVIILVDYKNFFRQGIKQYLSMDVSKIVNLFKEKGIKTRVISYEEIVNCNITLERKLIIYTSSQDKHYKEYIDDILYYLSKKNTLIPRYDIFKAHENKGFQELLKKSLGIESLNAEYFGNLESSSDSKYVRKYPLIYKSISGAGSKNVFMVKNENDLKKIVKKNNKYNGYYIYNFKRLIKQFVFKNKFISEYYDEDRYTGQYVLQEFFPELKEDWKVLVFGEKLFVLNRKVRDNDFRASGSGKLEYNDVPKEVLDFSLKIFSKLDLPVASLDVAFNNNRCELIEFQGLHFGPYTLINSPYYYKKVKNRWKKIFGKSSLEKEFVESYAKYINKENENER